MGTDNNFTIRSYDGEVKVTFTFEESGFSIDVGSSNNYGRHLVSFEEDQLEIMKHGVEKILELRKKERDLEDIRKNITERIEQFNKISNCYFKVTIRDLEEFCEQCIELGQTKEYIRMEYTSVGENCFLEINCEPHVFLKESSGLTKISLRIEKET